MAQNLVEYILDIKTKAAERGLDDIVDALEEVEKELKKTQKETNETVTGFEKFKKAGVAVGKVTAVMAAVGLAVAAAGKAAFEASKKVTDLVNELNDLSVRSGISSKTIQGLRQAMLSSGQSAEGLTEILGAISGQFAQLSTEGSAVEKKFESFGIAIRDTNGDLRSNNDILVDSIKLLQGISDSSERSRLSVSLFGEAGAKLNQALAAGEFEKFLSFTEKFGVDAGPEASRTAAHFQMVLSGLGTVLDGTLQKFVNATDSQNRFIQGMINLGGIVAFTGSLIDSFSSEIEYLTDKFLELLKFGVKQTILILTGPFALALGSIINNLQLFGIQIDFVNKAMSSLANFTIETADPTNRLGSAIDKAKQEMTEYKSAMSDVNTNLQALGKNTVNANNKIDDLGKTTKDTTEEIRTLFDVINDILGKFTTFDVNKFVGDLSIAFDAISKKLDKTFDVEKINSWIENLQNQVGNTLTEFSKEEAIKLGFAGEVEILDEKRIQRIIRMTKIGLGKAFSKAISLLGGAGSKLGSALSKGLSKGASLAVTGVMAVLKIAEKLGGKARSAEEIREMQRKRREEGKIVKMSVAEVQQRDIKKSVEQDAKARAKAIALGLEVLPGILIETFPKILVTFVDQIVFGFFKAIAQFAKLIIDGFKLLFNPKVLFESIRNGFRASIEEFFRRVNVVGNILSKRGGGRYIPSARGGIKFTGQDEGLAMLHRGEFVVPETGQMPQAVQRTMGMGQGNITININASVIERNAIDDLVRKIERRFQTFGQATSPLFGGR